MKLTWHARSQALRRGVPLKHIDEVLDYATPRRAGNGTYEFYLGRREVAAARRLGVDLGRYERTAVIANDCRTILTVYRADRPTKRREI